MSLPNRPTILSFPDRPASRRARGERASTAPTDYFFLLHVVSLLVALLYSAYIAVSSFCTSEATARVER